MVKHKDMFGEGLVRYSENGNGDFGLLDEKGEYHEYKLSSRFKTYSQLNQSEKKLISLTRGCVLDVGCGTGTITIELGAPEDVVGIDISPLAIQVACGRGNRQCCVADIFSYNYDEKFDTITLFGNNLGMGGTVSGLSSLLSSLKCLLKDGGQILATMRRFEGVKEMMLTPILDGVEGESFKWIIFDLELLTSLCEKEGLVLEVVSTSWKYWLVRMTKNTKDN